jgi:hypothetical protein
MRLSIADDPDCARGGRRGKLGHGFGGKGPIADDLDLLEEGVDQ